MKWLNLKPVVLNYGYKRTCISYFYSSFISSRIHIKHWPDKFGRSGIAMIGVEYADKMIDIDTDDDDDDDEAKRL